MDKTQEYIQNAKLAEQAERYEDMTSEMKAFVKAKSKLNSEERNLLSVAFKNLVGTRRTSWRILSSIEQKELTKDENKAKFCKEYRQKVEEELKATCHEVINLLIDCLIPGVDKEIPGESKDKDKEKEQNESKIFYMKMKGDYYRYLCEVSEDPNYKEKSQQAYADATSVAEALPVTSPIRLGLALNYSVFLYEILKNPEKACTLAKDAFDKAIAGLDALEESQYKDSTLIMQLLRDNLTLWTSEQDANQGDEEQVDQ